MKSAAPLLKGAAAALAIAFAVPLAAEEAAPAPAAAASYPETPEGAAAWVAMVEADLAAFSKEFGHVSWLNATYINHDSDTLAARYGAQLTVKQVGYANEAARYARVAGLDAETARKLDMLRNSISLPAPNRPGAAEELNDIATRLGSAYGRGKGTLNGQPINGSDIEAEMGNLERTPDELKEMWASWHDNVGAPMRGDYARMSALANEGAKELGFADYGAMWRSGYDMPPEQFAAETERMWKEVKPLYIALHTYVRRKLNEKYGDAVQPRTGPIRADLLGNMWAQQWGNIYPIVAPKTETSGYSLDQLLVDAKYDPTKMVKTGEAFYVSMGLAPLPETFWSRSQIVRPEGREVVCHASAWDLDDRDDIRIKMCTKVNGEDFYTVHHELGHNYYQRAYKDQPYIFKNGANDGFHEAIGDFVGLSALTPTYLNQIGLLETVPGADGDVPFLLKMALDKIAFMPFGLMVDRWRWQVFDGTLTPETYNAGWWTLRTKYQGITPPGDRPTDAFDPGAKYHVPGNVPYTRYFLAHVYQFQFHEAACRQAGWKGPLHRCSIYGNKEVGAKFNAMMEMGASRPWPDAMEAFTGQRQGDASAVAEYFKPLNVWLTKQNKGEKCGW